MKNRMQFFQFSLLLVCSLFITACASQQKVFPELAQRPADLVISVKVDEMPVFPEGNAQAWVARHLDYPREAMLRQKEGKVYVTFVVDETGKVRYPEILRSSGNRYLDEEGIRVVSQMPQWKPALKDGKPVAVEFTIPVNFRLTKKTHPLSEPMAPWLKEGERRN